MHKILVASTSSCALLAKKLLDFTKDVEAHNPEATLSCLALRIEYFTKLKGSLSTHIREGKNGVLVMLNRRAKEERRRSHAQTASLYTRHSSSDIRTKTTDRKAQFQEQTNIGVPEYQDTFTKDDPWGS